VLFQLTPLTPLVLAAVLVLPLLRWPLTSLRIILTAALAAEGLHAEPLTPGSEG